MPTRGVETEAVERRFTIGEHLEELRARIILCILCILACFIVCWIFKADILWIASRPHSLTMEKLGLPITLKVLSYQEGFFAYIKLCLIGALFLAYPVIVYQAWSFVAVGLYAHERRYVKIFLPMSFVAFVAGALFGYFFLIPLCLYFLINILGPGIEPVITMSQYITLVFLLTLALGVVFQIPLVMLLLARVGVCRAEDYVTYRTYILLGVFIMAAIITPPDPFSQMSTAIPMLGLYELGILLVRPSKTAIMYAAGIAGAVLLAIFGLYAYLTMPEVGRIDSRHGIVTLSTSRDESFRSLHKGTELRTGGDSRATLSLAGGAHIYVNQESSLTVTGKRALKLQNGEILVSIQGKGDTFDVNTPSGLVTIEGDRKGGVNGKGTETDIKVLDDILIVTAIRGSAIVITEEERRTVRAGRQL
ncbi:MAG: twin-arginine translocase subunit TatC, partial [Candidatus Brocadiales bacterium]